jgi:hypothetical protein
MCKKYPQTKSRNGICSLVIIKVPWTKIVTLIRGAIYAILSDEIDEYESLGNR